MSEKCTYCGGPHWRPDCPDLGMRCVAINKLQEAEKAVVDATFSLDVALDKLKKHPNPAHWHSILRQQNILRAAQIEITKLMEELKQEI